MRSELQQHPHEAARLNADRWITEQETADAAVFILPLLFCPFPGFFAENGTAANPGSDDRDGGVYNETGKAPNAVKEGELRNGKRTEDDPLPVGL